VRIAGPKAEWPSAASPTKRPYFGIVEDPFHRQEFSVIESQRVAALNDVPKQPGDYIFFGLRADRGQSVRYTARRAQ
jgi:hypothetical protein